MKKTTFKVVLLLFTFNCSAQWQQVGLDSTGVVSIATDGTNIFATTGYYGIALSTDDGNSWTYKGLSGITSIVIDGTNIFAGGFGVYLSTDTGNSWTNIGLLGDTITSLAVSGTNIFAGVNNYYTGSGGVFLSTDTGGLWTPVNNGLDNPNVTSLAIIGNNIFAGTNGGIFLSTDNGSNWTAVNNGLTSFEINAIGNYSSNIFIGTSSGTYLSTNNGNLWTLTNSMNSTWDFDTSGTNIFAASMSGDVYLSTNGGNLWTAVDNTGLIAGGIYSIGIKGNYIYAGSCCGGGIWRRLLSEVTNINDNKINNSYFLYPNPVNKGGNLFIESDFTGNTKVEIYEIDGTLKTEMLLTPETKHIDVSTLNQGIYIFKFINPNFCYQKKIVIN